MDGVNGDVYHLSSWRAAWWVWRSWLLVEAKILAPWKSYVYSLLFSKTSLKWRTTMTFHHLMWCHYFVLILLVEKAMPPHSSTLAWRIPWMEEPGGLQSMRSWRVGHNWATSLSLFTLMHWRRKWQPALVFLPGESRGQGSLVGCCLWGHTGSDMTEAT